MKRSTIVMLLLLLAAVAPPAAAPQESTDDLRRLRARVEERYDVVPLTDGIALRPKTRMRDVRLIEIADGVISINGVAITGGELRDRVGADAEFILRLSYLKPDERRALFAPPARPGPAQRETEPPLETAAPPTSVERPARTRRSRGDRVRIFGDVRVREDEEVTGQVVAVFGSARIDGTVGDQVVAVLGSVELGPTAVVDGDVVSVGGRVVRDPAARLRGGVTEVALGDADWHVRIDPWFGPVNVFNGFGAVPRLIGSTFRVLLLMLLTFIAVVVARGPVENAAQRVSDDPAKATLVGLAAWVLIGPMMLLIAVVLALSIVGIPLLLLTPFVVILLILMGLVGFAGTAAAVGHALRRRFGIAGQAGFVDVALGVVVLVSPVLIGRILALAGWAVAPITWLLIATGVAIEFLAWTTGFGAILTNAFSRWRARRTARTSPAA